jgi:hypothetical protein
MTHVHDLAILDRILAKGLVCGAGDGKTTFCVEQAVAVVCGLPVTDSPDECVEPAVSAYGRRIQDSNGWGTDLERAAGMRDFAIAQIGSKGVVDGREFSNRLVLRTINRVLPIWLRFGKIDESLVVACETAKDLAEGRAAAIAARTAAAAATAATAAAATAAAATAAAAASPPAPTPPPPPFSSRPFPIPSRSLWESCAIGESGCELLERRAVRP